MGLLAGDRKKQRWSHDPRGKQWSADKNKISNKIMEKMGWKDGDGLGANGTGRIDPVGVKYKMDNLGLGCTQKYDKQWIAHQDSFNDLLAGLNTDNKDVATPVLADKVEVSSLESAGKRMKHRYKKFTNAKDLTKATSKDMEGIFGRSSKSVAADKAAKDEETKKQLENKDPKFEQSDKHITQKENVQEYFKRKMKERTERLKLGMTKSEVGSIYSSGSW